MITAIAVLMVGGALLYVGALVVLALAAVWLAKRIFFK